MARQIQGQRFCFSLYLYAALFDCERYGLSCAAASNGQAHCACNSGSIAPYLLGSVNGKGCSSFPVFCQCYLCCQARGVIYRVRYGNSRILLSLNLVKGASNNRSCISFLNTDKIIVQAVGFHGIAINHRLKVYLKGVGTMALCRDGAGLLSAASRYNSGIKLISIKDKVYCLLYVAIGGICVIDCSCKCGASVKLRGNRYLDGIDTKEQCLGVSVHIGNSNLYFIAADIQILLQVYCYISLLNIKGCLYGLVYGDLH